MTRTHKPLIGISLDCESNGGYSPMPWYALRENYGDVVRKSGGVPFMLPHEPSLVEDYIHQLDGVIFTGGNFDIDPTLYGAGAIHETVTMKHKRTVFEMAMAKTAFAKKMPMLGICGGEQLINVMLGGTLVQHIPDRVPDCLEHEQTTPKYEIGHHVTLVQGTLLHDIVGSLQIDVNTSHHQAVDRVAPGLRVNCKAPDGVIEGIEHIEHPFCLGVQWHPEYEVTPADNAIVEAFIRAAGNYANQKNR